MDVGVAGWGGQTRGKGIVEGCGGGRDVRISEPVWNDSVFLDISVCRDHCGPKGSLGTRRPVMASRSVFEECVRGVCKRVLYLAGGVLSLFFGGC